MTYQQALQDIKLGYYEAAIAKLDPLLQTDPSQSKLWYAKALALLNLQWFPEGKKSAELAVRLNPSFAAGYQLLGNACRQLEEKKEAIAAYKQAAHWYVEQGNTTEANNCIQKIKDLGPLFIPNEAQSSQVSQEFLDKISFKSDNGYHEEALQDLNFLLELDPQNKQALAKRGLIQAKRHYYRAALGDIALAMQLEPDDLTLRLERAKIRLWSKDAEGAIADLSFLLEREWGDRSEIYCLRSQAYQQLNDLDQAFEDLNNALYLNPSNPLCYKVRGDIYCAREALEEALSNYRRAASLSIEQEDWLTHQRLQQQIKTVERQIQRQKEEAARIIRVPIKHRWGGSPIIEVIFNDSVPCDMVLDTGASIICITEQIARLLNIVPMGNKQFRVADGRIMNAPVGYVRSLAIQQAKADNLEVAILPSGAEGLLGQNYLWRYDVRILQTEVELYMR
ncbi:MAG: retroviral-like aspartic protease family protein [Crocosphaera sp.]